MISEVSGHTVTVALSGGVDSAAAAFLLKEMGYRVSALTMIIPDLGQGNSNQARAAGEVASALGIKHSILDVREEFERLVVEPFLDDYIRGTTPNPCVTCNRKIKFGLLLEESVKMGCHYFATGHYARTTQDDNGSYRLFKGIDSQKDQSYLLYTLDQVALSRLIMPLGDQLKRRATEIVRGLGISTTAPETQDICFLGGESYGKLIENRNPHALKPGPVIDTEGNLLGEHKGLAYYTVGQRRGLGISGHQALYVLEVRSSENTLVVGTRSELLSEEFMLRNLSFVSGSPPAVGFSCLVKTRYKGPLLPARVDLANGNRAHVRYEKAGPPAAPGQSAVFYIGEEVIGGGVITG